MLGLLVLLGGMLLLANQSQADPAGVFNIPGQAVTVVPNQQYTITLSTPLMNSKQRTAHMVAFEESGMLNISRMVAENRGNRTFFSIHFTPKTAQLLTVGDSIRSGGKVATLHSIQIVGSGLLAAA